MSDGSWEQYLEESRSQALSSPLGGGMSPEPFEVQGTALNSALCRGGGGQGMFPLTPALSRQETMS